MKARNIAEQYSQKIAAVHQRLGEEFARGAAQLSIKFKDEAVVRTPVDQGDLRLKWANMPIEKVGSRYIITITNPANYAAFVEFGYMQRPGMILKMREERGKLRFVQFLGYSDNYELGAPSGKAMTDDDGFVVIKTRKRFIEGRFMAREALKITQEKHWPKLRAHILRQLKATMQEGTT